METTTLKEDLLQQADQSKNAKIDRSNWKVCTARKQVIHRGTICANEGDAILFDPESLTKNASGRWIVTVYLAKNLGGVNTTRYASEFALTA